MSFFDKNVKQKEVAEFFSSWLNASLKTDFKAISDPNDKDIDYILKSEHFENRYLQLINCDSEEIIDLFFKAHALKTYPVDKEIKLDEIIKYAIKLKSEQYPKEVQKSLTLIVWANYIKLLINEDFLKKSTKDICNQTYFKEIFYIALPDNNEKNSALENNGQIIKLK